MNQRFFFLRWSPAAFWFLTSVLALPILARASTPRALTFEERVKAQEAIERVYYTHRIWPKENPQPKPPFEQMVPRAVIEGKVTGYLKKCAALDKFWQRPIQPEQLQAEMERMTKGTKDPAMLKELFAALGNDPARIAECLARPVLSDRLIHNWYFYDSRFHAAARERAERALAGQSVESHWRMEGPLSKEITYHRKSNALPLPDATVLSQAEWEKKRLEIPAPGALSGIQEDAESFFLVFTRQADDSELVVEVRSFPKETFDRWWDLESKEIPPAPIEGSGDDYQDPARVSGSVTSSCPGTWERSALNDALDARERHTAVWTGTEMILWGGSGNGGNLSTGSRYTPATDTWVSTSPIGCPTAREGHTAVWTGSKMIVWGGFSGSSASNTGAMYDPADDTWQPLPLGETPPPPLYQHKAVWTGTRMIVWGGYDSELDVTNAGAWFDPSTSTWSLLPTDGNCPSPRVFHSAVWTGAYMIVWGGSYPYTNTGGRYDPTANTWFPVSTGSGCPSARDRHAAVWTGTEMIVWGGGSNSGGRYSPSSNSWLPTSTGANCPPASSSPTVVWTGSHMIVWGGSGNTGGRYSPSSDTWLPTSTGANCPTARYFHTAVWTGSEMIISGGTFNNFRFRTGGRYRPDIDSWTSTSLEPLSPESRSGQESVWTGTEMLIWGGGNSYTYFSTGGRYDPALDSWTMMNAGAGCPVGRAGHTAIWTGTQMVAWGGQHQEGTTYVYANSGGRYNPASDTWAPTSTGTGCPTGRWDHTAVWSGSTMIVWGGCSGPSTFERTGGRYDPLDDTWLATSTSTVCPSGRILHTAVWTGSEMIIWGGYPNTVSGGRYNPMTDSWVPTSTGMGCPIGRHGSTAIWTDQEMIVWGGWGGSSTQRTGGIYRPATDGWTAVPLVDGAPGGCDGHSAVWSGTEMIVWGGYEFTDEAMPVNSGARFNPGTGAWTQLPVAVNTPSARVGHSAIWTGDRMIVWGGQGTATGGIYFPEPGIIGPVSACFPVNLSTQAYATYQWFLDGAPIPDATGRTLSASTPGSYTVQITDSTGCAAVSQPHPLGALPQPDISGATTGCGSVLLSTEEYSTYQWYLNGSLIAGATAKSYAATGSGDYSVVVTQGSCTLTSPSKTVVIHPLPSPSTSGGSRNTCPATSVTLSTDIFSAYAWRRNGILIPGATSPGYSATLSGSYSVVVTNTDGCEGASGGHDVEVVFCLTTEISPPLAIFPARLEKNPTSSTGYYLYFQSISGGQGYNIYEGTLGSWYSHGGATGNSCNVFATDLGTGELRAEIAPSTGDHYYLVTAFNNKAEGTSGFASSGAEIDPAQSTCSP